jgi:hypothetical protein
MVEASDRLLHAACSLRLDDGDWLVGTTTGEILRVSATREIGRASCRERV